MTHIPRLVTLVGGITPILDGNNPIVSKIQYIGKNFSIQQTTYRDVQQPPPPSPMNSSLEEKVIRALNGLDQNTQLLHSHTQSLTKLETQLGQLADAINRREEG